MKNISVSYYNYTIDQAKNGHVAKMQQNRFIKY